MKLHPTHRNGGHAAAICLLMLLALSASMMVTRGTLAQGIAIDPGVRGGAPGAGQWIAGLTKQQLATFEGIQANFAEVNQVTSAITGDLTTIGLGPTWDGNSCSSCHAQPAIGGSSPAVNQLFGQFQLFGAQNNMPFFETLNGPTVVARFPLQADGVTADGSVHRLFVISGRADAGGCNLAQPDFDAEATAGNLVLRSTTPTFGGGLVEIIQNSDIVANMNANLGSKQALGIAGHPNYSSEDGSIGRFGWKAQARSLLQFAAEAYNIEEGVSTEFFPGEANETSGCILNPLPEDHTDYAATLGDTPNIFTGDPERFAIFMRFLDQPVPEAATESTTNGQNQFNNAGCVLCHTQSFTTPQSSVAALSGIQANLFSDLLVHHMGPCLADGVVQGTAQGDEFRTAPLWGAGQRVFFLHDGRTSDLMQAIQDHLCAGNGTYPDSEANQVIDNFNALPVPDQQDVLNFLRSL